MKRLILTFSLAAFLLVSNAFAGTLDDFESAKSPESNNTVYSDTDNSHHRHRSRKHDESVIDNSSFADFFIEIIFHSITGAITVGGEVSARRVAETPNTQGIIKRQSGELLIPNYRFDLNFQRAIKDIKSADMRFEFGSGMFGVQFRNTYMIEGDSKDHLRLSQVHAMYRMSFGNYVGINLGIGLAQLSGNSRKTDLSFAFPIYFHPSKHFGLELKTSTHFFESAGMLDLDYSAIFTQKNYSIALGYRELIKAGVDITGPYAGLSIHF